MSQLQNGVSTSSLPPFIVDLLTFKDYPRSNSFFFNRNFSGLDLTKVTVDGNDACGSRRSSLVRYRLRKLIVVFFDQHFAPSKRQSPKIDELLEKTSNNLNKEGATV